MHGRWKYSVLGAVSIGLAVTATATAQDSNAGANPDWCRPACQWAANSILTLRGDRLREGDRAALRRIAAEGSSTGLRDYLVKIWDGISAGLASVGWGEGGSIETVTETLAGAAG